MVEITASQVRVHMRQGFIYWGVGGGGSFPPKCSSFPPPPKFIYVHKAMLIERDVIPSLIEYLNL